MDTPVVWMLIVFVTNLAGLIIYLLARPRGDLVECPHCHERRLAGLAKCPHCGQP
jgi:hypothetical protein